MAYDAFIKLSDIKGESLDDKHKDEIEVFSFSWGAQQTGTSGIGSGGGSGKVSVQDFSFVKKVDKSSAILFQKCCDGTHIPEAMFVVRKAGGTQLEYLKIKMTDVLISSYQPGGTSGGDDIPMEQLSLNFSKVEFDYQPQGKDGKAVGGPVHGGWDLKTNKKV
ncbi:MAG: Hcp family type VI secretion system effector [Planctomycetia bacterium]